MSGSPIASGGRAVAVWMVAGSVLGWNVMSGGFSEDGVNHVALIVIGFVALIALVATRGEGAGRGYVMGVVGGLALTALSRSVGDQGLAVSEAILIAGALVSVGIVEAARLVSRRER